MTTFNELRQEAREAKRELIINAAQELFSGKDFRQVTVREIAKTAGISPGGIYRYYSNMDELFVDIFLLHVNMVLRIFEEEYQKENKCSIERYCEIHVEYLNDNMTFYQMMAYFMLADQQPSETSVKMDPIMKKLIDNIEKILIESGSVKDSRLAAHALFSSLNGTMISYARYPGRSLGEIKSHTLRLARLIAERFQQGEHLLKK